MLAVSRYRRAIDLKWKYRISSTNHRLAQVIIPPITPIESKYTIIIKGKNLYCTLKGFSHINFFFSVCIMLFSLKSYAKKCFTVWRNYFSIKSYSTFSAKMFQAPSFGMYTIYGILYTLCDLPRDLEYKVKSPI